MNRPELREAALDLVRRTTSAQRLPERVDDPAAARRVAALLADRDRSAARRAEPTQGGGT